MNRADLRGASLIQADLRATLLGKADLRDADLSETRLDEKLKAEGDRSE
ncbi:MAG TPA: pentapeptide repeat-containing protein [Anaerolineales bacterium]|nr:pentapeptide repeat-containing protein [Anaerolineales bacterium]